MMYTTVEDLAHEEIVRAFKARRDIGAFVIGPQRNGDYSVRAGMDHRDYARCRELQTAIRICELVRADGCTGARLVPRSGMGCNGAGGKWTFGL